MRLEELPKWALPAAVGVVSFGVGAAVGYFATKRQYDRLEGELEAVQLEFDFDQSELNREVNKMVYAARELRKQSQDAVTSIRELAVMKDLPVESSLANHPSNRPNDPRNIRLVGDDEEDSVEPDEPVDEEDVEEVIHIFAQTNDDPDWDYETECRHRHPDKPYVLHRDEFFADEMGIQENGHHETLTYYRGDQVLVSQRDVPIYDIEALIGPLKFGHGSGDPAIFYVRNEAEQSEFEIVEDDGYYQEAVLGEVVEREAEQQDVRHSRRPGKFRDV